MYRYAIRGVSSPHDEPASSPKVNGRAKYNGTTTAAPLYL